MVMFRLKSDMVFTTPTYSEAAYANQRSSNRGSMQIRGPQIKSEPTLWIWLLALQQLDFDWPDSEQPPNQVSSLLFFFFHQPSLLLLFFLFSFLNLKCILTFHNQVCSLLSFHQSVSYLLLHLFQNQGLITKYFFQISFKNCKMPFLMKVFVHSPYPKSFSSLRCTSYFPLFFLYFKLHVNVNLFPN